MSDLPTGTVTFLFTDIEGSTRLWSERGKAMGGAVKRHDDILRTAIEDNGGFVFATGGDAFSAAFQTTDDALAAAVEAQVFVTGEDWGEVALLVRMGIHTGEAEERDDNYFGPAVNETARLMSAGHGGQILVSETTQRIAGDRLPDNVVLVDLGERRLKGLDRRIRVYQVTHPDLGVEFPALRGLGESRNNLPSQLTGFVGREAELREVGKLLEVSRLLTLTGAGGSGKTRLAIEVAAEALDAYPDGVWLVDFASIGDPDLILQPVAAVLGLRVSPGLSLTEAVAGYLRQKMALLVLDNAEHLLEAVARLSQALLESCPDLHILATSRERLGISGETVWQVPPLGLPEADGSWLELLGADAVRLFAERAASVQPGFSLTDETGPVVARICRRLDGMPLAIELAATRIRVLSPPEIARRLDDRFRLLTGGSAVALPRQQTLRTAVDWSYDLLSDAERTLFDRLSVFEGGFGLEAAEAVCAAGRLAPQQVLDLLSGLFDKSLVATSEGPTGTTRYALLETLREYGRERLAHRGETDELRRRHLDFFLAVAEEAEPELRGPEQKDWFERLDADHANLRAALKRSLISGEADSALRLTGALWWFWQVRGYHTEGRSWLNRALTAGVDSPPSLRIEPLIGAGMLAYLQGDGQEAIEPSEEAVALSREAADSRGVIFAQWNLGEVATGSGDVERAEILYAEALAAARELDDPWLVAWCLHGFFDLPQFDHETTVASLEEGLQLSREVGDGSLAAMMTWCLGETAEAVGDYERAAALYEQSRADSREPGFVYFEAASLTGLGFVALRVGDSARALQLGEEALDMWRKLGDSNWIVAALNLVGMAAEEQGDRSRAWVALREAVTLGPWGGALRAVATLELHTGRPERAARLLGGVDRILEGRVIGIGFGGVISPSQRSLFEGEVEMVREAMNEGAFEASWAEGRSMTLEDGAAYALEQTN